MALTGAQRVERHRVKQRNRIAELEAKIDIMRLIHFEDYTEDCPAYSEDFSLTTDTMEPVTCPACIGLAKDTCDNTHSAIDPNPDCPFCCGMDLADEVEADTSGPVNIIIRIKKPPMVHTEHPIIRVEAK